ncbi:MAG: hypothetical protein NC548_26250 [Lachnospiraceae bacterium]|nr:hypothetical protein [Lachnospiraceae bacterium]
MAKQTVKRARTLIKIATQVTVYTDGVGASTEWQTIEVCVGHDTVDGAPIMSDCLYCEWLGSYGSVAIQQQADGVTRPARVRMPFVQSIYDALIAGDVRIYLDGKTDAAHTFTLASAADNYLNENKMLEFNVKQYATR